MSDAVPRIRRFNRAVASEIGALDQSYLGRGRPLGAARLLCTIGAEGASVAGLRERLGIDSGLMSRLLRGLEEEGLLEVSADPDDARRRVARPTKKGRAEIAAYEALSDDRAARMLARAGHRSEAFLEAVDRVATILAADRIAIALADPETDQARACLAAYYAELARRFEEGFSADYAGAPGPETMRPPDGAFFLASHDGRALGCVALRRDGPETAEIKRLWVAPEARGLGLAARLMGAAEARAREMGLARVRLNTNRALTDAIAMYRRAGWQEVAAFNAEPHADHWFEKPL